MRWRFKIPLIGVLSIAVIIASLLVLLYQSHILENWVNRYLADRLAGTYNLDVSIADIDGSFLSGFKLGDVLVRFYDEADTVTLAYLPQVSISYKLSDLWHRRWIIDSLIIVNPHVYLIRDSGGVWELPQMPKNENGDGEPVEWTLNKLRVVDGELNLVWNTYVYSWHDIDLLASAKSEEGTHTIHAGYIHADSEDRRIRLNNASGSATIHDKTIALQDVIIAGDSTRLAFSGIRKEDEGLWIESDIDSAMIHLPDIFSFLGSSLDGDIHVCGSAYHKYNRTGANLLIQGIFKDRHFDSLQASVHYDDGVLYVDTVHGTILKTCNIAGFGGIDFHSNPKAYHLTADIDSFDLNELVFNSFRSDLSGHVVVAGRGFNAEKMAIDLDLDLDESRFDQYHFHAASGQMTVGNEGLYLFTGFQFHYYDNLFLCSGGITYDGAMSIDGRAELNDLSAFEYQTFIDLPGGRASAEFSMTGSTNDPDLRAYCVSDSIWLYDFFSPDLEVSFFIDRFTTAMRGPIVVKSHGGNAWGFPCDSLMAEFILDSTLLFIDTGCIANEFSRTEIGGTLDYGVYPQVLTLDTVVIDLKGRQFLSDGTQEILIDSNGYEFKHIDIRTTDGDLTFGGRVEDNDSIDLSWEINNISIAPWLELLSDSIILGGRLSSVGSAYNTIDNPEFSLQATVDSLTYETLLLGALTAYLKYDDRWLIIDSSFLMSPQGLYTASGDFPINLTLEDDVALFDSREQDITISATDSALSLASFLLSTVEYVHGDFGAEVYLTGMPKQPHLNGKASLSNGTIKLYDLRDPLQEASIELEMSDQLLSIPRAQAVVRNEKHKTPGLITGRGTILVRDINSFLYALRLQAIDLPINYELGDVTGLADAEIEVNGETPPTVTGTINMASMTYRESFEETGFSLLSTLESDDLWDLDLMVEFPSNFRVENDDIDAEFGGEINILRTIGVYNFLGTLEVIRGKYFFFDKTFRMTPGGIITYDNIEELDPKLDLIISTRMRTPVQFSDFESESNYSYELSLAVTGTLKNPIITGTGDTPLSSESILPTLLADYRPGTDTLGGNPVLSDRITVGGVDLLASQMSRIGTRTLGVETFEISPDVTNGFDPLGTRLTIGTYTTPNLYIFGSSYFDINKGQEVGVEYRLGRHHLFEGRRDEYNLYHFNFKMQWEFVKFPWF